MGTSFLQEGQKPFDQTIHERRIVAPNIADQRSSSERSSHAWADAMARSALARAAGFLARLARSVCTIVGGKNADSVLAGALSDRPEAWSKPNSATIKPSKRDQASKRADVK
jgi:hypothetical protein